MFVRGFVLLLVLAFAAEAAAEGVVNGDFAAGLQGWEVLESGGQVDHGGVSVDGDHAVLTEGDSFLVSLRQVFQLDRPATSLAFTFDPSPGFDTSDVRIADVFEASILDLADAPVTPVWTPFASSFFNVQESGLTRAADGVTVDQELVTIDATNLPVGEDLTLLLTLVGADADKGSSVRIGDVVVTFANRPPVANAGPPVAIECGTATEVTLDGSGSSDPDGDPLSYVWTDQNLTPVGLDALVTVPVSPGTVTYTLTVEDDEGLQDQDTIQITVSDTHPPSFQVVPEDQEVQADETCQGSVPDLTSGLVAVDDCYGASELTFTQTPPPGTALTLGVPVTVTLFTQDPSSLESAVTVDLLLVDETAPVIGSVPEPAVVQADASCGGGLPDMTPALVGTDNCTPSGELVVIQEPAAATALSLGEIPVTFTLEDATGNSASGESTATLVDLTAPVIETAPEPAVVQADASCGGVVPDMTGAVLATDNCTDAGDLIVAQSPLPDTPLGLDEELPVTFLVSDAADNGAEGDATAVLRDVTAPSVEPLERFTVEAASDCSGVVPALDSVLSASDNCTSEDDLMFVQTPVQGTTIAPGDEVAMTVEISDGSDNAVEAQTSVGLDREPADCESAPPVPDEPDTEAGGAASTGCACDAGGAGERGALGGRLLLLVLCGAVLLRRRRWRGLPAGASRWLALVLVVGLGWLHAPSARAEATPVALGVVVSGEVVDPEQATVYSFDADLGQVVFVEMVASDNASKLNWSLTDLHGRLIDADFEALDHLGPVTLMGGSYELSVVGEDGGVGSFELRVHDAAPKESDITTNVVVTDSIDTPGQVHIHRFSLEEPQILYFDAGDAEESFTLLYRLSDSAGRVIRDFETELLDGGWFDSGPFEVSAGDY
ncbi:MAG: PKD domain-containing protein, partial [Myxococcota bacterium]|nr:PKD domain-containing protein [Myxococcota bacterium]